MAQAQGRIVLRTLGSSRRFAAVAGSCRQMPEFAQLLFPLLVANSDEYGRLSGDAFTVKHAVFPSSPRSEEEFETALKALHTAGLILRYCLDGECYIQIVKFEQGQPGLRLDRRKKPSLFPAPPKTLVQSALSRQTPASAGKCRQVPVEGKRREEKVREEEDPGAGAPASPVPALIKHFHDRFQAVVGASPKINGPKDGATLKRLSQERGVEEVRRVMDAMFASPDPWVRGNLSIGTLSSQYNKFLIALPRAPAPSADDGWFEECQRLHNGECNGSGGHRVRMQMDAVKTAKGAA